MKFNKKEVGMYALALFVGMVIFSGAAMAGTGGTEFDGIWVTITDWIQGTLGRIIAGAFVLIGIIAGIARQSIMAFAMGVSAGIGLFYSPDIINNIMTATLPVL